MIKKLSVVVRGGWRDERQLCKEGKTILSGPRIRGIRTTAGQGDGDCEHR